jgi:UDP-N-acetylglucosamine--N-acetylmuramyl-(pentapeptide) pyrophosphoryl-undecaprenol N-acetylglucosamine transferase
MRIVLAGGGTGGHLYPGMAIARAILRADPTARPHFIGALRGIERDVLPLSGFAHTLLDLHPLYRPRIWNNWRTITGAIRAWRDLGRLFATDRPSLIVGTGGYAAGLAMAYGVVHGIPIVQQAGDSFPGLTARAFARYSREIYLNFPEAARHLRVRDRSVLLDIGAPIEPPPEPLPDRGAARAMWGFPRSGGRVLLIYGGSQGSLAINSAVAAWLPNRRAADLHIIWATGRLTYGRFAHHEGDGVRVVPYLSPISDAYAAADIALCRAGAMATAELFAWGVPSILVPLPTAAADHQTINARTLEEAGAAVHIPQAELSSERLGAVLDRLLDFPAELAHLRERALARARPTAATDIAARILSLVPPTTTNTRA